MPMLSSQIQPKTLIHPHEQCLAAYQQWSRVMEYITLHWKASSQLKSLAAKPAADPNLLRLLNATLSRPSSEGDTETTIQNGGKDYLNSGGVCSDGTGRILTPWKNDWKIYQGGISGLHEEMEDFYNYMSPMPEEKFMRTEIVNRLRQTVTSLWPNAEVKVYGSFETGLYLPTSDIDVVIKSPDLEPLTALTLLEQHLAKQTDCDEVKLIRTSVPIVKFTDKTTATRVDVSINIHSALTSADFIKEMIQTYPELKCLGFVLKQFLASRGLLESFNGGISSYCLILLIVSYLQLNPEDRKLNNLGVQLIKFLELYGRHFNYLNCGIRVTDGGSYFRKGENSMGDKFSLLCVEDPFNPENDVGQSCFGAMKVREEFDRAFRELCDGVLPQYSHLQPPCTSLLGRILHIAPEVVAYRRYISDRFFPSVHAQTAISTYVPVRPSMFLPRQQQQQLHQHSPYNSLPPPQQYTQFVHHLNHPPPTQSQQPLPYNQQQQMPHVASAQLHLFQHFPPHYSSIHPFVPADGLQPASFRLPQMPNQYAQPNFHFQPSVMPPLHVQALDSIYPVPITVAPAPSTVTDDRSDSDSLSSQHSSTRSPSANQANGNVCNSNTKGSNDSEAEQELPTPSTSATSKKLPNSLGDACSSTATSATSTTTTSTYVCNNNSKSVASTVKTAAAATVVTSSASSYFSSALNRSKNGNNNHHGNNERNGSDHSGGFRCDSSNGLDTLCEITSSRQSSSTTHYNNNNNSSYSERQQHHQQSNLHGYTDDGPRSHYNHRGNNSKHNNKNQFYSNSTSFGRSSPTQASNLNRPSNQSRQSNSKGSSNHLRNHQIVTTTAAATSCHSSSSNEQPLVKSVVTASSHTLPRNRSSNVATSPLSPTSQQVQETSSSVQQNYNRNGVSNCQSGSLSYGPSNSRGAPKKGNSYSLSSVNSYSRQSQSTNYKNAKISSSSSSSSSCSPTYSPASMTPAVAR